MYTFVHTVPTYVHSIYGLGDLPFGHIFQCTLEDCSCTGREQDREQSQTCHRL